jgi:hypothetical protein
MKLEGSDLAALNDAQRLAVLEALVVGVAADGKVTPDEVLRFDEIVLALPWGLDRAVLSAMVKGAHERIRGLRSPALVQDYVDADVGRWRGSPGGEGCARLAGDRVRHHERSSSGDQGGAQLRREARAACVEGQLAPPPARWATGST